MWHSDAAAVIRILLPALWFFAIGLDQRFCSGSRVPYHHQACAWNTVIAKKPERFAFVAMANGRLHAAGKPEAFLTEDTVCAVFGLDSRIILDPTSGRPLMLTIGRHRMMIGGNP